MSTGSSHRYSLAQIVVGMIVAAAIPGIPFLAGNIYQTKKHSLPDDVRTIAEFEQRMPTPEKAERFTINGQDFIELIAVKPGFPATPSGNPRYIFDKGGKLVFWTIDSGDSTAYWRDWGDLKEDSRPVTVDEAFQIDR